MSLEILLFADLHWFNSDVGVLKVRLTSLFGVVTHATVHTFKHTQQASVGLDAGCGQKSNRLESVNQ